MGENSKIEWCDHTFNPWTGCTKVSPACDHCYAEGWAKRSGLVEWGPHAARRRTSDANWRKPLRWNQQAAAAGQRRSVFCASLADIFDNHRSINPQWRDDLWHLIASTPHLDWLLLTKRPQNIARFVPPSWQNHGCPAHVWLGTTVENQIEADRRIPYLFETKATVYFVSAEPLLGPLKILPYLHGDRAIGWVITGGESGPGARPTNSDHFRLLLHQCAASPAAFFFKQWGPRSIKHRLLDGREWNEVPNGGL